MRTRLAQNTGWLAFASTVTSTVALLSHIPLYASGAVVPVTHSHSVLVEGLGAINFFTWSLFILSVNCLLWPRALRPARWGLALGVVGTLFMSGLHLLFMTEVLWFSDSLALFGVGCGACVIWWFTMLHLTRATWNRTQGNVAVSVLLAILSVLAYPLWPVLIWQRTSSAHYA